MVTADVGTLIAQQTAAVAATSVQADTFLNAILGISNVNFSYGFNIDDLIPNSYNYASVPVVNVPVVSGGIRPDVSALGLSAPPAAPTFSFTALQTITLPVDDLLTPTNVFSFNEGVYDRTLLDPWRAKLLADMLNGGYGIDTADEVALLNRARDREVEAASTRMEEAARAMATRGFPLPPGELSIHIDRAWQDMQNKVADVNRDIYIDRAKRFVENRRFTITEVREMEQILIGLYNSIQERALNVSKATIEYAIAIFNAQITRYRARLEAAIAAGRVQFERAQAETAQATAQFEVYRSQILGYTANIQRVVDTAKVQVDAYRVDIDADRVLNDGQIAVAGLQQKVIEATVQQNIQISNLAIENAKAKLLATIEGVKFRLGAVQYGSEKYFAILTALESTINTLAVQTQTA